MKALTEGDEKRIARLEKYAAKVEEAQAEMVRAINSGELEALSEEEIKFQLSWTPNAIAECGLLLAKIHRAYGYAKNDTKTIKADIRSEATRRKVELGLSSATDRDDYVQINPKYQEAVKQELEWECWERRMQVIYERYQDLFVSARKLASLIVPYNKAQDDYVKYNKEYGAEDDR